MIESAEKTSFVLVEDVKIPQGGDISNGSFLG